MISPKTLFHVLLVCLIGVSTLSADDKDDAKKFSPEETQIHEDIRNAVIAGQRGDADTLFKYAHPRMFERRIGSKEATRETLGKVKEAREGLQKLLGKFEPEVRFEEHVIFVEGKEHQFAIVPVTWSVDTKFMTSEMNTFYLGIRDDAKSDWKYMDGTKLDQEDIQDYFSDFPTKQPLPLVKNKNKEKPGAFDKAFPLPTPSS